MFGYYYYTDSQGVKVASNSFFSFISVLKYLYVTLEN